MDKYAISVFLKGGIHSALWRYYPAFAAGFDQHDPLMAKQKLPLRMLVRRIHSPRA